MTQGAIRCLSRPGSPRPPRTNVLPNGPNKEALLARTSLGQFLEANMMRPLHFTEQANEARINDALDTMTIAERIAIEIEMQTRNASVHSFDYDPLR